MKLALLLAFTCILMYIAVAEKTQYVVYFHYDSPCTENLISLHTCREQYELWEKAVTEALTCTPTRIPERIAGNGTRFTRQIGYGSIIKKVITGATNFLISYGLEAAIPKHTLVDLTNGKRNAYIDQQYANTRFNYVGMTSPATRYHVEESNKMSAELSKELWLSFRVACEILSNTANLKKITRDCLKRRVAIHEMAELVGDNSLTLINDEYADMESITECSDWYCLIFKFTVDVPQATTSKPTTTTTTTEKPKESLISYDGPINVKIYIGISIALFLLVTLAIYCIYPRVTADQRRGRAVLINSNDLNNSTTSDIFNSGTHGTNNMRMQQVSTSINHQSIDLPKLVTPSVKRDKISLGN